MYVPTKPMRIPVHDHVESLLLRFAFTGDAVVLIRSAVGEESNRVDKQKPRAASELTARGCIFRALEAQPVISYQSPPR